MSALVTQIQVSPQTARGTADRSERKAATNHMSMLRQRERRNMGTSVGDDADVAADSEHEANELDEDVEPAQEVETEDTTDDEASEETPAAPIAANDNGISEDLPATGTE